MRYGFFSLVALAALAGCATGPSLQTRMAVYIGANTQTLVQNLGVPDRRMTVNGIEYLAYDQQSAVVSPWAYSGGYYGSYGWPYYGSRFYPNAYGPGIPSRVFFYGCETTFMVKNDKVLSFTLRGNDCD